MPTSPSLRQRLTEIAQRFVDEVLVAIEQAPLAEVADALSRGASDKLTASADRTRYRDLTGDRPGEASRRYVRRSGDQIQRLRDTIVQALRNANGPMGASQIAQAAGVRTADLAFPMAQLREQGLVSKQGLRAQAVYRLSAHEQPGDAAHGGKKHKKKRK